MSSGRQTLSEWATALRAAGDTVEAMAANLARDVFPREFSAAIRRQESADGVAWKPTRAGTPALRGAMSALSFSSRGNTAFVHLTGHEVFHQYGTARLPARPILPSGSLRGPLGRAIRTGVVDMGSAWLARAGAHGAGRGSWSSAKPKAGG